jgi:hypothetical protein
MTLEGIVGKARGFQLRNGSPSRSKCSPSRPVTALTAPQPGGIYGDPMQRKTPIPRNFRKPGRFTSGRFDRGMERFAKGAVRERRARPIANPRARLLRTDFDRFYATPFPRVKTGLHRRAVDRTWIDELEGWSPSIQSFFVSLTS